MKQLWIVSLLGLNLLMGISSARADVPADVPATAPASATSLPQDQLQPVTTLQAIRFSFLSGVERFLPGILFSCLILATLLYQPFGNKSLTITIAALAIFHLVFLAGTSVESPWVLRRLPWGLVIAMSAVAWKRAPLVWWGTGLILSAALWAFILSNHAYGPILLSQYPFFVQATFLLGCFVTVLLSLLIVAYGWWTYRLFLRAASLPIPKPYQWPHHARICIALMVVGLIGVLWR